MRPLDGRYLLGRCIGRGGVGEVYIGWQVALDRPVAIKLLRRELMSTPAAVARFEREARTTSLLNHPQVVTVIDIGRTAEGTHFVVMELLDGETLGELLDREGKMSVGSALEIAVQVARGMGAGQGVGLVHRDLKPDNLFMVDGNHIKVLDFGLATLRESNEAEPTLPPERDLDHLEADASDQTLDEPLTPTPPATSTRTSPLAGERLTRPGALMGTPRYMAPEQVLGWGVDQRTDLYSFGVILFELLTGRTPFQGPGPRDFLRQHLHEAPPDITTLEPDVPVAVRDLVATLLSKSPSDRFQDWSDLSDALRRILPKSETLRLPPSRLQAEALPSEPYRFLTPFTAATRGIFFGRELDLQRFRETWEHPDRPPLVLLTGASGVGKTSFLSARIVPALEDTGHRVVRIRGTARPLEQLTRLAGRELRDQVSHPSNPSLATESLPELLDALFQLERRPLAIVIDQFEELFTQGDDAAARVFQAQLASVLAGADARIRFIVSLREDYLGATLRTLHPLPVDQLARTLPLRPLDAADIAAALEGPGREGLPVRYAPFRYEPGLVEVIVNDLLSDTAGEVAPRIQAVGARLWAMCRDREGPSVVTFADYNDRLGGAQGILARVLDEAITGLDAADQGMAKEMLRVLTHLPGSPTSRPVPEDDLLAFTESPKRRAAVLRQLEDRWRVIHGFQDPRRPGKRVLRVAHESLIARIQQYGEEGTDRDRARQLFMHGFDLWLKGGERDEDLLAEHHFDEIQHHIDDLVLRTDQELQFYQASTRRHDEYYLRKHHEVRRRARLNTLQMWGLPTVVLAVGIFIGQVLTSFTAVDRLRARALSSMSTPGAQLQGASLHMLSMPESWMRGWNLDLADLREADLRGADLQRASLVGTQLAGSDLSHADLAGSTIVAEKLWNTSFEGTDLRSATVWVDPLGADFSGAIFDWNTRWRADEPAPCALGPGAQLEGCTFEGATIQKRDLERAAAAGTSFNGADLSGSRLNFADLSGASLRDARLVEAQLVETNLAGADLTNADLSGARLQAASLRGADLTGTDLRGANIDGVDLTDATICNTRHDKSAQRWLERSSVRPCARPNDN